MLAAFSTIKKRVGLTSLFVLTVLTLATPAVAAGNGAAKLISSAHGRLSAHWWQYVTSFSADEDPRADQGEVDCTRGQQGPVLFLAGAELGDTADRTCTIARKPLFFPIINLLYDNAPGEEPITVAEKRVILDNLLNDTDPGFFTDFGFPGTRVCGLEATIDGEPINFSASIVRAQSPPFELVTGPDGNPPDADDPEAISDGFWVLLPALSSGEHTLHFRGRVCEFDSFDDHPLLGPVEVTYHLTVQ